MSEPWVYIPLEIEVLSIDKPNLSLEGMRLPKKQTVRPTREGDRKLAENLVLAGDDHAKMARSIEVTIRIKAQVGFLIEYLTYEQGRIPVSSSSEMHTTLRGLKGDELANQKQLNLPTLVYTRQDKVGYQWLRHVYLARRNHEHPDWQIFCDWVETLPHFEWLIYPEKERGTLEQRIAERCARIAEQAQGADSGTCSLIAQMIRKQTWR